MNISGTDQHDQNLKSIVINYNPFHLGKINLVNFGPLTKTL